MIACLVLGAFASCKRDSKDDPFLGPEIKPAKEGFAITTWVPPVSPGNYASASDVFAAQFNQEVTYTLTLVGQSSGAKRVYQGTGVDFDASDFVFQGEADGSKFFKAGETIRATLSVIGSDQTESIEYTVSTTKNWAVPGEVIYLTNFDGGGFYSAGSFGTQWFAFDDGPLPTELTYYDYETDLVAPIEGNTYGRISGLDGAGSSPFFMGGMGTFVTFTPAVSTLSSDPSEIYYNIYLNNNGVNDSRIKVDLRQRDGLGNTLLVFSNEINVNWSGWRLVSIPLSQFANDVDGGSTPGADLTASLSLLNAIGFVLLNGESQGAGTAASISIDMITLTKGKPFSQTGF